MKRNFLLFGSLAVLILGTSIGLTSCKDDDDPSPEIVTDETAYFIAGVVKHGNQSLEGVKVSTTGHEATTGADGKFELKVSEKGKYPVTFSKSGYVTVTAETSIASDAHNRSSAVISQDLIERNDPFTIVPDKDQVVGYNDEGILFSIPAGAVKEATDISITPYTPGRKILTNGPVYANLITMSLEPNGFKFEKPVEFSLKDFAGNAVNFGTLKHIVEADLTRTVLEDVHFDVASGTYKAALSGFSNHALAVSVNTTNNGLTTQLLETKTINNLGASSAKEENVTMTKKYGWTIDSDIASLLRSKYPTLSTTAVSGLVTHITTAITSLMGSAPSVGDLTVTETFKVSGDVSLKLEIISQLEKYTFSFPLIFENGSEDNFDVTASKYIGTQVNSTYTFGSSHTDHSGGSGQ